LDKVAGPASLVADAGALYWANLKAGYLEGIFRDQGGTPLKTNMSPENQWLEDVILK